MARMNKYEARHIRNVEAYKREVQKIFDEATKEAMRMGIRFDADTGKPFSFDDYPATKRKFEALMAKMHQRIMAVVRNGIDAEYELAQDSAGAQIRSVFPALSAAQISEQLRRLANSNAKAAFEQRRKRGLGLSDKVWKYTGQYKQELEMALDIGIGEGNSAQALSREVRKYLRQPNMLFRKVRDKHGVLHLSKRAKAYHPGRGVYRSSAKNALRMVATETNIAYRSADYLNTKASPWIVGIRIVLSNNHTCKDSQGVAQPFTDICDKLAGRYPKDFKFTGWHPNCRCHIEYIHKTDAEVERDTKRMLRGEKPIEAHESKNYVGELPKSFKDWYDSNKERISRSKTTPYFIEDNFVDGQLGKGLKIAMPTVKKAIIELFKGSTPQEIKDFIIQNIAKSCTLEIKSSGIDLWNDIVNQLNNRIKQFGLEKFGNIGTPRSRNAEASWDEHGNILNLNITALRNKTAIKKAMSYKKRGILYSFAYEDSDDYVRAVIDHELGHLILSKYANVSEVAKLIGDVGKSIMVNGKSFNPINDILGYYASTEEHEFFAEAFSFYMGKNREKLDDRIKGYFERLFSKHGFNIDGDIEL